MIFSNQLYQCRTSPPVIFWTITLVYPGVIMTEPQPKVLLLTCYNFHPWISIIYGTNLSLISFLVTSTKWKTIVATFDFFFKRIILISLIHIYDPRKFSNWIEILILWWNHTRAENDCCQSFTLPQKHPTNNGKSDVYFYP